MDKFLKYNLQLNSNKVFSGISELFLDFTIIFKRLKLKFNYFLNLVNVISVIYQFLIKKFSYSKWAVLFFLFFGVSELSSQDNFKKNISGQETTLNVIKNDVEIALKDGHKLLVSPSKWSFGEASLFLGFTGLTAIISTQDMKVKEFFNQSKSGFLDSFVPIGEYYGSGYGFVIIPSTVYLSGLVFNDAEVKKTGRMLIEAVVYSGLTVQLLKFISGRARPYVNTDQYDFKMFNFKNSFNSFPSGHTVIAFSISSVLSARIKNVYASIGLYSLAAFTAIQRIYSDNHWLSDTFAAAVLGIAIGNAIVSMNEENNSIKNSNTEYLPIMQFNVEL